jgi:hypothetical protein
VDERERRRGHRRHRPPGRTARRRAKRLPPLLLVPGRDILRPLGSQRQQLRRLPGESRAPEQPGPAGRPRSQLLGRRKPTRSTSTRQTGSSPGLSASRR